VNNFSAYHSIISGITLLDDYISNSIIYNLLNLLKFCIIGYFIELISILLRFSSLNHLLVKTSSTHHSKTFASTLLDDHAYNLISFNLLHLLEFCIIGYFIELISILLRFSSLNHLLVKTSSTHHSKTSASTLLDDYTYNFIALNLLHLLEFSIMRYFIEFISILLRFSSPNHTTPHSILYATTLLDDPKLNSCILLNTQNLYIIGYFTEFITKLLIFSSLNHLLVKILSAYHSRILHFWMIVLFELAIFLLLYLLRIYLLP
jgi:hypothetical protein